MSAERINEMTEQVGNSTDAGHGSGKFLFGPRSPERHHPNDEEYITTWLITDEAYEQYHRVKEGGE